MVGFLDKVKIKTAAGKVNHFDLSGDHITTANFMEFSPIYNLEMVPNSKIELNVQTFSRLAPMPQPTFGSCLINNRAFFVPYRVVWKPWNDFITGARRPNSYSETGLSDLSYVPRFMQNVLASMFVQHHCIDEWDIIHDGAVVTDELCIRRCGPIDLDYPDQPQPADPTTQFFDFASNFIDDYIYTLTPKGRYFIKVLESIGYKVDFSDYQDNDYELSALPLLCLAKIYCDWYYSGQYANFSADYVEIASLFEKQDTYLLTYDQIYKILNLIEKVNYDSDYFTSNWDYPSAPNPDSDNSNIAFGDPIVSDNYVTNGLINGEAVLMHQGGDLNAVSQFMVDALHKLNDYMKRHQLAGSRALDRYLARFGVTLSADKLNRSLYCGKQNFVVQFGDVMSHSDTDGASLGDYAGKGVAYDPNGKFSFDTDEFGMFFVINSIIPQVGYVQGIDRINKHIVPSHFYTPEFDNLSVQATASNELYVPFGKDQVKVVDPQFFDFDVPLSSGLADNIFGYLPRYAEYKVGKSRLTGDFRYGSINAGKDSWHLFRMFKFEDFDFDAENVVHSEKFIKGVDANQYLRLFYNTTDDQDYFNLVHRFGVKFSSPMKPLYDYYDFDERDGGKEVTVDVNGVKAN